MSADAVVGAGAGAQPRPGRGLALVALVALALWLAVTLPLALGERTLYYRDVFELHLPLAAFGAGELAGGSIPAIDPAWGHGQPYRGNPQTLAFYPGRLLYLALPFWSAFNLHYALHWLLAALAMALLARELAMSRGAALVAALAYAGSGWALSGLTFYHLVTVTAWWPLVMWGAVRGGRRGVALGGVACGLALLGGAPEVAALGLVPLALAAVGRHGVRRGAVLTAAVVAVGLVVALPQVVATARVLPFTFRGVYGMGAGQVGLYSLQPLRLLELVLPLPFGWPGDLGHFAFWSPAAMPRVPLVLSLHCGLAALLLAAGAVRRRPGWAALAAAGLAGAWLGGLWPEALATLSAGLFRYPEKMLVWCALALPLLAGWGLDAALADAGLARRLRHAALTGAALAVVGGAVALTARPALAGWLRPHLRPGSLPGTAALQLALAAGALLVAALLLVVVARGLRRPSATLLAAAQLAGLLQLAPLVMTDATAPYRTPAWRAPPPAGAAVVSATVDSPFGDPPPRYRLADTSVAARLRLAAADLEPAPGALAGYRYPLAPDADGLFSPLTTLLLYNLPRLDGAGRAAWLRSLGVDAVVAPLPPPIPGLQPLEVADRAGVATALLRLPGSAPAAWWPARLEAVAEPAAALARVAGRAAPADAAAVVAPAGGLPEHRPGGVVRLAAAAPDRLLLEVDSDGGVAVVGRAYQRLYRAASDGVPVELLPVDLQLLGVVVPPGRRRVEIFVPAWPEAAAGGVALLAAAAALAAALTAPPRRPPGAAAGSPPAAAAA